MKKVFLALLCCIIFACAGCGDAQVPQNGGRKKIVVTVFPACDWIRETAGERADLFEIINLSESGADMHSYQPTVSDIMDISSCDMFIYVGGASDEWTEDVFKNAQNPDMTVINLIDVLGDMVKTEEVTEGMESREEGGDETDEHVWLSLRCASVLCQSIAENLSALDADGREIYSANAAAYIEKLNALDKEYSDAAEKARHKTLLFGDRFPFRYLADDYGLGYYAAFPGCSAETEASFDTIIFLANKAEELELSALLQIDGSNGAVCRTIRDSTASKDQKILTLNSMQSITRSDIEKGASYLSVMQENLEVLKEALN